MKKHSYFWMALGMAFLLLLPIYSTAQSQMKLNLMTKDGDYITTTQPNIKSFFMGGDQNLFVLVDQPFLFFTSPDPIIDIGNLSSNCSNPGDGSLVVTFSQDGRFSFRVSSPTGGAVLSAPYLPGGEFIPSTGLYTSWAMASEDIGNFFLVFQAVSGEKTSQRVVMLKIVPPGYTLAVTVPGGNGSVTKSPDKTAYNINPVETVQLTANPASGFYFSGWGGDLSGSANPTTITMDRNKSITATFTQTPTYTVNVSIVNTAGGSVSPTSRTGITSGGTATFTVTTNSGYTASVSEGALSGTTWTISNVTSDRTATITFTQPPLIQGEILPWGLNSLMAGSRISFEAGETKTFIARVANNVRGFDVVFYPMQDFIVTCTFKMPLKPDGAPYSTIYGKTEFTGIWAGYNGSIKLRIWTTALGGIVLDPFIYPGDFIITMTADRKGWGFMNTDLQP